MEQTVHAIEIDERAEVGQVFDRSIDAVANFDAFQELLALFAAFLLDQLAAAQDHVLAVVVNFNNLKIVGIAHELLQILRWHDVDLRGGKKCLDSDVHHEPAFDDGFDLALDQAVALENGGDFVPILAVGRLLFGKDDHALIVLEALEQHIHFVADFQ